MSTREHEYRTVVHLYRGDDSLPPPAALSVLAEADLVIVHAANGAFVYKDRFGACPRRWEEGVADDPTSEPQVKGEIVLRHIHTFEGETPDELRSKVEKLERMVESEKELHRNTLAGRTVSNQKLDRIRAILEDPMRGLDPGTAQRRRIERITEIMRHHI